MNHLRLFNKPPSNLGSFNISTQKITRSRVLGGLEVTNEKK